MRLREGRGLGGAAYRGGQEVIWIIGNILQTVSVVEAPTGGVIALHHPLHRQGCDAVTSQSTARDNASNNGLDTSGNRSDTYQQTKLVIRRMMMGNKSLVP